MASDMDGSSQLLFALGVMMVLIGVGVGIWGLTLLHTCLYHPGDVPLVENVLLGLENKEEILSVAEHEDGISLSMSKGMRRLVVGILALAILVTLGSIMSAFISGGAKIIKIGRGGTAVV